MAETSRDKFYVFISLMASLALILSGIYVKLTVKS